MSTHADDLYELQREQRNSEGLRAVIAELRSQVGAMSTERAGLMAQIEALRPSWLSTLIAAWRAVPELHRHALLGVLHNSAKHYSGANNSRAACGAPIAPAIRIAADLLRALEKQP